MTKFKIILTALFVVFIVGGLFAFATFRSGGGRNVTEVTLWGTLPKSTIETWLSDTALQSKTVKVKYVEKDENMLEADFVEALASGSGPDLIMFPHDLLLRHYNKLSVVPFESFSERDFKDTFIEEGELFLSGQGVVGFPISIDPMVMYWNRPLISSAGLSSPPRFWDEFYTIAPAFNEKNQAGNLKKSIVALGVFDNVKNAKEILSLLIMQSGSPIIGVSSQGLTSVLNERFNSVTTPADSALRFFTDFGNSGKPIYSWGRNLPSSLDAFGGETLATYFGFSSELKNIRRKNPNLNFDVSLMPQIRGSSKKMTYGKLSALVIPKNSGNAAAAVEAAILLTSRAPLELLAKSTGLPPVRRDLLSKIPGDAVSPIFYQSALVSKAWLDPSSAETTNIFRDMVDSVVSGRERVPEAVARAHEELNQLLQGRR